MINVIDDNSEDNIFAPPPLPYPPYPPRPLPSRSTRWAFRSGMGKGRGDGMIQSASLPFRLRTGVVRVRMVMMIKIDRLYHVFLDVLIILLSAYLCWLVLACVGLAWLGLGLAKQATLRCGHPAPVHFRAASCWRHRKRL